MSSGYVGILTFEVHFAESGSLKGKRRELVSLKSALQRAGAAVAEVDHHDVWQRARLTLAVVDRSAHGAGEHLDVLERAVLRQGVEAGPFERALVTPEDLAP